MSAYLPGRRLIAHHRIEERLPACSLRGKTNPVRACGCRLLVAVAKLTNTTRAPLCATQHAVRSSGRAATPVSGWLEALTRPTTQLSGPYRLLAEDPASASTVITNIRPS